MPASGVTVPDCCVQLHRNMQLRKKERCIIYIIDMEKMEYKMHKAIEKTDDQKEQFQSIVQNEIYPVLGVGNKDQSPNGVSCFTVWDFKVPAKSASGQETNRLVYIGICLDDMHIKEKTLYASSHEARKDSLKAIWKMVEVKSLSELDYDSIMETLK